MTDTTNAACTRCGVANPTSNPSCAGCGTVDWGIAPPATDWPALRGYVDQTVETGAVALTYCAELADAKDRLYLAQVECRRLKAEAERLGALTLADASAALTEALAILDEANAAGNLWPRQQERLAALKADATDATQLATLRQQLADERAAQKDWQAKAELWHRKYMAEYAAHEQDDRRADGIAAQLGAATAKIGELRQQLADKESRFHQQAMRATAAERRLAAVEEQLRIATWQRDGWIEVLKMRTAKLRDLINSSEYWLPPARFAELIAALGEEGRDG